MVGLRTFLLLALTVPQWSAAAAPLQKSDKSADAAFRVLQSRRLPVQWHHASMLRMDINCDGKTDYAVLGKTKDRVAVAVISGPAAAPAQIDVLEFLVDGTLQDGVCSAKVSLAAEGLEYDPEDPDTQNLPGYRPSQCKAFRLNSGDCDALHFYWDHDAGRTRMWRR